MNEEQRAVLAAIARMEESPGTLIDEYTVARTVGILPAELAGHEYVQSAGREQIHRALDDLEGLGLVRLDREGFWRPRTTLAGRRALQRPLVALPPMRPSLVPQGGPAQPDLGRGAVPPAPASPAEVASVAEETTPRAGAGRWPTWWPMALRYGDPALAPIIVPVGALLALLLVIFVGVRLVGGRGGTPTATPAVGIAETATAFAAQVAQSPTPGNGGAPTSTSGPTQRPATTTRVIPTPTPASLGPTPTAGPQAAKVMIVNTENQGAWVYGTPAGERHFAIPEGFIVDVIGPDERDTKGNNWKHISYGDEEGWVPEEYTTPAG
jgi:hypothetical protein